MDLERRKGESAVEHHKRLVYGKLVNKTLADIDYAELSEFVYGKRLSSDVARREMYGSRYTLDLLEKEGINSLTGTDIVDEIEAKTLELKKERQKFYDQRRELVAQFPAKPNDKATGSHTQKCV